MPRRSSKTVSSGDVARVKTPEVTEGNAVMYDEIGMNHLTTAKFYKGSIKIVY